MLKVSAHDAALALLATSLVFVVLFWRLGTPTFWDPDEAHYAETSREMIAAGDWSAPFYNEQPFFDKPVLFHQLQAAAMNLVPDPEAGARLVPAVAALGLLAITVWFGTVMVSRDVGIVAGLMLGACPGVFGLARYAILDTLFTMFMFGGASCLAVAALRGRTALQYVGYVGIALGVQTKGPIALVLCGLTMLILIVCSTDLRRPLLALHWAWGLAIIAALSAPWFTYMYVRFKDGFVNGYILDENVRLFAASRFANQPGYGFYVQILAGTLLPWTGLLIGRLIDDARAFRRDGRLDGVEAMLWAWTLAVVGFLRSRRSNSIITSSRRRRRCVCCVHARGRTCERIINRTAIASRASGSTSSDRCSSRSVRRAPTFYRRALRCQQAPSSSRPR